MENESEDEEGSIRHKAGLASQEKFLSVVDLNVACINLQTQSSLQILITALDLNRHNKLHLFHPSCFTPFEISGRELALGTMV